MGNGVFSISIRGVKGGSEVIARKRTSRGTRYISDSIVVLRQGKTKEEFKAAVADVAARLYGKPEATG